MKSVLKVSLLAATVMLAVGCQKEETKTEAAPQAEQVQAETGKAVHLKPTTIKRHTQSVFHLLTT